MNVNPVRLLGGAGGLLGSSARSTLTRQKSSGFGPATVLDLRGKAAASIIFDGSSILSAKLLGSNKPLPPALQRRYDALRSRDLLEASTALLDKKYDKVREVAAKMLRRDSNDAAATHLIARSHQSEGNIPKAIEFFGRAAQMAPDDARFASDLRNAQLLSRPEGVAVKAARQMLGNSTERAAGLRLMSVLAERSQKTATLLALGDAFMSIKAKQPALGAYYTALDLADNADLAGILERADELMLDSPKAPIVHKFRGDVLKRMGRLDEAITAYRTARDLNPTDGTYIKDLANAYADRGRLRLDRGDALGAKRDYEVARTLRPFSDDINRGLGESHMELGRVWLRRGALSSALGELNAARLVLPTGSQNLERTLAGLYFSLANRFTGQNDLQTAASTMQKAYDLNKNLTHKTELAKTRNALGLKYIDDGDYNNAIIQFQAAVDLFGNNQEYADNLQLALDLKNPPDS